MNPVRKKRLYIILAILAGVGIAVALALSALQENINLFYTPTQIATGEAPQGTRIAAFVAPLLGRRSQAQALADANPLVLQPFD